MAKTRQKQFKKKTSAQFANSSAQGMMGNETGSREERVPMRQITLGRQTVSNGITWLLQTCQLECELHVSYENEEVVHKQAKRSLCTKKKITIRSRQGHKNPAEVLLAVAKAKQGCVSIKL